MSKFIRTGEHAYELALEMQNLHRPNVMVLVTWLLLVKNILNSEKWWLTDGADV
jgi:hypothetical protein